MRTNIILIGMPGAGKSTNGLLLAKALGKDFLDTDVLIQVREAKTLQQIMDSSDYLQLRDIEESVLLDIDTRDSVIATGGSAVYSDAGMDHLAKNGLIVYLDVPLATLEGRIQDYETRGIAKQPGQDFAGLFVERSALYRRYAAITIECDRLLPEEVVRSIVEACGE